MTPEFNRWWDADALSQTNPYDADSPAFWAWEGWHAAQVQVTEELRSRLSDVSADWIKTQYGLQAAQAANKVMRDALENFWEKYPENIEQKDILQTLRAIAQPSAQLPHNAELRPQAGQFPPVAP
jgi:ribonuclease HI